MKNNNGTKFVLMLLLMSVVFSACSPAQTPQPTPTLSVEQVYADNMVSVLMTLTDFEQAGADYDLFLEEVTVWYDADGIGHNNPYWVFLNELASWYDVGLKENARELSLEPKNAEIVARFSEELHEYQEVVTIAREAFMITPAIPETQEAHDMILDCLVFNFELNDILLAIISGDEIKNLRENSCLMYEDAKRTILDKIAIEEEQKL